MPCGVPVIDFGCLNCRLGDTFGRLVHIHTNRPSDPITQCSTAKYKYKSTKIQKYQKSKLHKYKITKIQNYKNTKLQNTKFQKYKKYNYTKKQLDQIVQLLNVQLQNTNTNANLFLIQIQKFKYKKYKNIKKLFHIITQYSTGK